MAGEFAPSQSSHSWIVHVAMVTFFRLPWQKHNISIGSFVFRFNETKKFQT